MNEYSKKIHNQSTEIGRELLAKMSENASIVLPEIIEDADEQKAAQEKTLDFGNSIVQFLATKDIPARYATMSIDKLIEGLQGLKQFVDGTVNMYEDEYMSRMFGVKNEQGKYRREEATIAHIVMKLEEAKTATGGNREDFFNDVAPTLD